MLAMRQTSVRRDLVMDMGLFKITPPEISCCPQDSGSERTFQLDTNLFTDFSREKTIMPLKETRIPRPAA